MGATFNPVLSLIPVHDSSSETLNTHHGKISPIVLDLDHGGYCLSRLSHVKAHPNPAF
jgi:hypothetical protein